MKLYSIPFLCQTGFVAERVYSLTYNRLFPILRLSEIEGIFIISIPGGLRLVELTPLIGEDEGEG